MYRVVAFLMVSFLFLGCSSKKEVDVNKYTSLNKNKNISSKINDIKVFDKRETNYSSKVYSDNVLKNKYPFNKDLKTWYKEALKKEFINANMYSSKAPMQREVYLNILKVDARYDSSIFDEKNMKVHIDVEVVINTIDREVKTNILIDQTMYKMFVFGASDFELIVNEALSESVSKAVGLIAKRLYQLDNIGLK